MKLGIFAKTFEGKTPHVVLEAAKTASFGCVQYNLACSGLAAMPDHLSAEAASEIAIAADDCGVTITAVSATYNMIHPDPSVRKLGIQRLEVLASRCAEIGTSLLTLCTGTRHATDQWHMHVDNNTPEAWNDLLVEMQAALTIAERFNILLGIEPELANVVNSAAKARQLLDEMQSPRLKIVFDAANLFEVETLDQQRKIISEGVEQLAGHIIMAHAKDRAADGAFIAAGQGVIDFDHYISCLRTTGFSGPLITHGLNAAEAPDVAKFLNSKL